tara:strand:- start:694 stop:1413 length:720 start_codon:yes stop_codon:yes gene_type:complete
VKEAILVHGLGLSGAVWAECNFKNMQVYTPDLLGFGENNSHRITSTTEQLEFLIQTVGAKQWNRSHVVLHSIASMLVIDILASGHFPGSITLVEGNLFSDDASWSREIAELSSSEYQLWQRRLKDNAQLILRTQLMSSHPKSSIEKWSAGFRQFDPAALQWMARAGSRLTDEGVILDSFCKIPLPRLFIAGDSKSSSGLKRQKLEQCDVSVQVLKNCGHYPMLDDPKQFVATIKKFIGD